MATDTSIVSNALLMVGAQTINSLGDGTDLSDRQRIGVNLYPMVRDYVLSSHPWSICIKRVTLNPDAVTLNDPWNDYANRFTLPPDYLRVISIGEQGIEADYRIEDGKLLCDDSPIKLRYLYRNDNPAKWTPLLVMAVTLAMRQVLAYPITQSASLEQLIDQAIEPMLRKARAIDSQDQPPEMLGDARLLGARFGDRWWVK